MNGEAFAFYNWLIIRHTGHSFIVLYQAGWNCDSCRREWKVLQGEYPLL
jgi:hypothetical protein